MKKALLILALASSSVFAYYEDPKQEFDMTRNISNNMTLTFRQAADIQQACNAETRRRGYAPYTYKVDSCSFWNDPHTECLIITELTANFHTIGHEVRHCLQGQFHHGKDK
jgi:hypothetical protein